MSFSIEKVISERSIRRNKLQNFAYVLKNFFTHKDFLVPGSQIPGTLFTPLAIAFSCLVMALVLGCAHAVSGKSREQIRKIFAWHWIAIVVLEIAIVTWESLAAKNVGLDLQTNLSLYPCSLYIYTMPFIIWGKGVWKKMACGYMLTLGLLGALVNFLYPATRLPYYSCISFPGFHTFFYHGSMLFTCIVLLRSGICGYQAVSRRELFYPCIPTLLLSIPANLINYSSIDADYMFFRGKMDVVALALPGLGEVEITLVLYGLYILVPALFFLPSYLAERRRVSRMEELEEYLALSWA